MEAYTGIWIQDDPLDFPLYFLHVSREMMAVRAVVLCTGIWYVHKSEY